MSSVTGTGSLSGRDTDAGALTLPPESEITEIINGIAPVGPVVRVNVIVRWPRSPGLQPSRSYSPTPSLGCTRRAL